MIRVRVARLENGQYLVTADDVPGLVAQGTKSEAVSIVGSRLDSRKVVWLAESDLPRLHRSVTSNAGAVSTTTKDVLPAGCGQDPS